MTELLYTKDNKLLKTKNSKILLVSDGIDDIEFSGDVKALTNVEGQVHVGRDLFGLIENYGEVKCKINVNKGLAGGVEVHTDVDIQVQVMRGLLGHIVLTTSVDGFAIVTYDGPLGDVYNPALKSLTT